MQLGTTKDQGLYNKPSAAVNPGALAAGTLPQHNTIRGIITVGFIGLVKTKRGERVADVNKGNHFNFQETEIIQRKL